MHTVKPANPDKKRRPSPVSSLVHGLKAVSNETRARVLTLLSTAGALCVCELSTVLRLPHYAISRHLNLLKRAALLESRREGTYVFYSFTSAAREGAVIEAILRYLATANGHDAVLRDDTAKLQKILQLRNKQRRLTAYCERTDLPVKRATGT